MFDGLNDAQVNICASREIFDYLLSVLLVDFIVCHPNLTFMRTSDPSAADIVMTLISDDTQKGMFALDAHPSDAFAMTDLWPVLADFLT